MDDQEYQGEMTIPDHVPVEYADHIKQRLREQCWTEILNKIVLQPEYPNRHWVCQFRDEED